MGAKIPLFPTYSKYNTFNLKFELEKYSFYYENKNQRKIRLSVDDLEGSDSLQKIYDEDGIWNPDEFNLGISNTFHFSSCNNLFGENGIAAKDAVIGFGVIWKSSDSKQRGVIPVGEIRSVMKHAELSFNYVFPKAKLRGIVTFQPVLYIKDGGHQIGNEKILAKQYGTIIGNFEEYSISLDGKGSFFPIFEINDAGGPLWQIKCDWENPTLDSFSDYVQILLNKAHANYKYIDRKNKAFNMSMLKEIMSSALTIMILKLKYEDDSYWSDTESGNDLERGSVSEAVNYFINVLNWDTSKPENLSMSIRNYLDQRM